jgi:Ankyrin repeats (3 copies)
MNDLDDQYRRASALDDSRPSEEARRNILAHAAQLAAAHRAKANPGSADRRVSARQRWKPAIFGSLMAAALAGLLITPRFLNDTRLQQPSSPIPSIVMNEPVAVEPPSSPANAAATTDQLAQSVAKTAAPARQRAPSSESAKSRAAEATANFTQSAPVIRHSEDQLRDAAAAPSISAPRFKPTAPLAQATSTGLQSLEAGAALRSAAESGDLAVLQSLLDGPADLGSRDADGRTALMLAAMHGQSDAVNVLLAHGADPNTADAQGVTPLRAATLRNYRTIVDALSRAGAR